jgi:hypothetical protein
MSRHRVDRHPADLMRRRLERAAAMPIPMVPSFGRHHLPQSLSR